MTFVFFLSFPKVERVSVCVHARVLTGALRKHFTGFVGGVSLANFLENLFSNGLLYKSFL